MEEIILEAVERTKQPGKFREAGFVPGVIYGDSVAGATSVKFNAIALRKIINKHGSNAKIWIKFNDSKKFGFIKEVQQNPISRNITHLDVQMVSKEHEIKMQIPIIFNGDEALKTRQLQLQIYKSEISVFGKMALMPDSLTVDVSDMQLGDSITLNNFTLDEKLKVNEMEDVILGMIIHLKNQAAEVEDEAEVEAETK
ncbi:MAG: 50S ribosomal protein L25 [Firmicutes bacterium HGW-Firmicutes-1]|jgi:large subunit ribosomal protein L25|nr:MAG: 50S ribosomal protein L25 [Firmicutes bacterium HGW-Firmicutes-1]